MTSHLLVSYYYYRRSNLDELVASIPGDVKVFADSGAFSANSQNTPISVQDYAEWLHRWKHLLHCYVNLDVIRDWETSASNLRWLERDGLNPMPVFHGGSPFKELDRLIDNYSYIALGGLVARDKNMILAWAARQFERAASRGTYFHGFGQTKGFLTEKLPWYSVDSSSWGGGHRFGTLPLFDLKRKKFVRIELGNHRLAYANAALIREHGGDPAVIATVGCGRTSVRGKLAAQTDREMVMLIAMTGWRRWESWLQSFHGPIGPPSGFDDSPGMHVYLTDGSSAHLFGTAAEVARRATKATMEEGTQ